MSRKNSTEFNLTKQSGRIKYILNECGINQKEFCKIMSITEQYASMLVNEKRQLSNRLSKAIENTTGFNSKWILTGSGDILVSENGAAKILNSIKGENIEDELHIEDTKYGFLFQFSPRVKNALKSSAHSRGMDIHEYIEFCLRSTVERDKRLKERLEEETLNKPPKT